MARIINTDSTGKKRNQLMRTSAEILRRLSQKQSVDDEVKDMVAMLVYCLREIQTGIDQSASAWEKRDYWMKAEEFRQRWHWVTDISSEFEALVRDGDWGQLPQLMIKLLPKFSDIRIIKLTRKPSLWRGTYQRLLQEQSDLA